MKHLFVRALCVSTAAVALMSGCSGQNEAKVVESEGAVVIKKNALVWQTPDPKNFKQSYCDVIVDIQDELKKSENATEINKKVAELFRKASEKAKESGNAEASNLLRENSDSLSGIYNPNVDAQIGQLLSTDCGFTLSANVDPELIKQQDERADSLAEELKASAEVKKAEADNARPFSLAGWSLRYNTNQAGTPQASSSPSGSAPSADPFREAKNRSFAPPFASMLRRKPNSYTPPERKDFPTEEKYAEAYQSYSEYTKFVFYSTTIPLAEPDTSKFTGASCGTLYSIAQMYYLGAGEFPTDSVALWNRAAEEEKTSNEQVSKSMTEIANFLSYYGNFPTFSEDNQKTSTTAVMLSSEAALQKFSLEKCGFLTIPSSLYR